MAWWVFADEASYTSRELGVKKGQTHFTQCMAILAASEVSLALLQASEVSDCDCGYLLIHSKCEWSYHRGYECTNVQFVFETFLFVMFGGRSNPRPRSQRDAPHL
jgi:hypothetical protein